jgi:hypothetical protein
MHCIAQAKVNIGIAARSVAFSPNGAHLAVGTATGAIKVLQVCKEGENQSLSYTLQ